MYRNIWALTQKKQPKVCLTLKQREQLFNNCLPECIQAFRSAIFNRYETRPEETDDLEQDAAGAMLQAMDRFDLATYEGKIGPKNIPGSDQPKTLEFYFINWFQRYVNILKKQAFKHDNIRGKAELHKTEQSLYQDDETEMELLDDSQNLEAGADESLFYRELAKASVYVRRYHFATQALGWSEVDIKRELNNSEAEFKVVKALYSDFIKSFKMKVKKQGPR